MDISLTERLKTISSMIRGRVCADIGTDHALLPCYLILSGKASKCYACDIAKGPLERAKANIEKYGLEEKIETVLYNGISPEIAANCDSIVIAGMGGNMIADILSVHKFKDIRLVLQPMTKQEVLREYLISNGFVIEDERTVFDNGKYYTVMQVGLGVSEKYSPAKLEVGKQPLLRLDETDRMYIKNKVEALKKRLNNKETKSYVEEALKELEEVL